MKETEYLIDSMKVFLDQANYDNEQLANVTRLMDVICRQEGEYPISVHLDVDKYNGTGGSAKLNRCRAIDVALDAMYPIFKRAAYNNLEPLDFSTILFYPSQNFSETYNLSDLINTSWIKSQTEIENICKITNAVKDYAAHLSSKSTGGRRLSSSGGILSNIVALFDNYFLEPYFGFTKRLYWEGSNGYETVYNGISSQMGSIKNGLGKGVNRLTSSMSWGNRISKNSSVTTNSTGPIPTPTSAPSASASTTSSSSLTTTTTSTTVVPTVAATTSGPSRVIANSVVSNLS